MYVYGELIRLYWNEKIEENIALSLYPPQMSTQITHRIVWDRTKSLKLECYVNNVSEFTSKITWNSLHYYHRRQSFNTPKRWNFPCPRTEGLQSKRMYSSTLILELEGGEWLDSRPRRITPGKVPRYPLKGRAGLLNMPVGLGCVDRLGQNISIVTVTTTLSRLRLMLCRETNLYLL